MTDRDTSEERERFIRECLARDDGTSASVAMGRDLLAMLDVERVRSEIAEDRVVKLDTALAEAAYMVTRAEEVRDAAIARAEAAERERDEARLTVTEMRGTPDERTVGIRRRARALIERDPIEALANVISALAEHEVDALRTRAETAETLAEARRQARVDAAADAARSQGERDALAGQLATLRDAAQALVDLHQWSRSSGVWVEAEKALRAVLDDATAASAAEAYREKVLRDARGLDTDTMVRFYEHDFYPLSNFSAFPIRWPANGEGAYDAPFPTSEHVYHWEKLRYSDNDAARRIRTGNLSAHDAFKIGQAGTRREDWDAVKVDVMREILRAKTAQHEYVKRKLLATGDRELVEDSWRDDFWGWGPNRDGKNMLGKLWMEIREEIRRQP